MTLKTCHTARDELKNKQMNPVNKYTKEDLLDFVESMNSRMRFRY